MDKRQAIGSWLSGPRAAAEDAGVDFGYRGEQLGLPEEGPGSIARPGRRLGALAVDWGICVLIAYGLITDGYGFAYLSFDFSKSEAFAAAQETAKTNKAGLWNACVTFMQSGGRWQTEDVK